jgi:integrating conjugative element protein (TIGR03746 family)
MFMLWKKEDQDRLTIQALLLVCVILLVIIIGLWLGWYSAPRRLRVYCVPSLDTLDNTTTTQAINDIPKAFIYAFAQQVWQDLHYWGTETIQSNRQYAYHNNIERLSAYFTPAFKQQLLEEAHGLRQAGQLQRVRVLTLSNQTLDIHNQVTRVNQHEWQVSLTLHLSEYTGSMQIKSTDIHYPLRIVRQSISSQANPYGLAIAGFSYVPARIGSLMER